MHLIRSRQLTRQTQSGLVVYEVVFICCPDFSSVLGFVFLLVLIYYFQLYCPLHIVPTPRIHYHPSGLHVMWTEAAAVVLLLRASLTARNSMLQMDDKSKL